MSATPLDLQVNMQALSGPQAKTQAMQNSFAGTEAMKSGQTAKKEGVEKQSKVDEAGQTSDPNDATEDNADYVISVENFDSDRSGQNGARRQSGEPLQIIAHAQGSSELEVKAWNDKIGDNLDIQA